jgi:signal peptidase II
MSRRWWVLVGFCFLIDQLIKSVVVAKFEYSLNQGVAWGWASGVSWQLINVGLILAWLALAKFGWPSGLVVAGALGNLVDRWHWGGVVDYFRLGFLPQFNLADIMIVSGVVGWILKERRWSRR